MCGIESVVVKERTTVEHKVAGQRAARHARCKALRRPLGACVDRRQFLAVAEHIIRICLVVGVRRVETGDIDLFQFFTAEEHHIERTAAVYRIRSA